MESLFSTLEDSGSVLEIQAQIGRNVFCHDLSKLRGFGKVEPVERKCQGSLVRPGDSSGSEAPGPLCPSHSHHHISASCAAVH